MTPPVTTSPDNKTGNSQSSAWSPFGQTTFAVLWLATVLSNVGTWMHDVGAGWLMTVLSPSPFVVAAVQAATTLPVFMFALLAGAIADIVDRRRLLIGANIFMAIVAGSLALLVSLDLVTPAILLVFTFLLGTGAAFMAPAWQAIVPSLVPRPQLSTAIALNSMGINVSRAIGPALAGLLIAAVSLAAPFAFNAISFLGIIAALVWWKPTLEKESRLPPERIGSAIVVGLRYALNSGPLRATLLRSVAFFIFASALWSMLPLVARVVLEGDATLYGVLLASVGVGAVLSALMMPSIKSRLGANGTVAAGMIGTSAVLFVLAMFPVKAVAIAAAGVAGVCWIGVLSSLQVSVQTSLPNWVRARGLSIYLTVFFGSMSVGSLIWGQIATVTSIETALLIAAVGAVVVVPLTWRFKLNQGEGMDLAPSMHWPAPIEPELDSSDRGPVLLQTTYRVAESNRKKFVTLMQEFAASRRRNGGYNWSLMQDTEDPSMFIETWYESSWIDHLRHHERVTGADKETQAIIWALHEGGERPPIKHYVSADAHAAFRDAAPQSKPALTT